MEVDKGDLDFFKESRNMLIIPFKNMKTGKKETRKFDVLNGFMEVE